MGEAGGGGRSRDPLRFKPGRPMHRNASPPSDPSLLPQGPHKDLRSIRFIGLRSSSSTETAGFRGRPPILCGSRYLSLGRVRSFSVFFPRLLIPHVIRSNTRPTVLGGARPHFLAIPKVRTRDTTRPRRTIHTPWSHVRCKRRPREAERDGRMPSRGARSSVERARSEETRGCTRLRHPRKHKCFRERTIAEVHETWLTNAMGSKQTSIHHYVPRNAPT